VVNLLIYLADQLLRGCQSTDNQFQALQNQEIEGFSVHGSRLLELEAEVVQIQLFIRISLCYLISVDQQDLVLGGFFCSSLSGHLQTLLYFPIVLDFRTFLSVDNITLFTLVLLKPLREVIFHVFDFFITLFYPLSLYDKKGE
jgi:hypothetical protein